MKLGTKLILISTVAVVLILVLNTFLIISNYEKAKEERIKTIVADTQRTFEDAYLAKTKVWMTNALGVANNEKIIESFLKNNRTLAGDYLNILGDSYKKNTDFQNIKIHLIDKDLKSFYKNWKPDNFGESLDYSKGYAEVKRTKKPKVAMEVSSMGLNLKGLFPVMNNGEFLGIVNFEGGLNSLKRTLDPHDINFVYFMDEASLKIATSLKVLGKIDQFILSQKDFDEDFFNYLKSDNNFEKIKNTEGFYHDNKYLTVAGKLDGFDDAKVGIYLLGVKHDIAMKEVDILRNIVTKVFGYTAGLFLALIVFIICYFVFVVINRGIKQIIRNAHKVESEIMEGHLDFRPDASQVGVDFRKIIMSINNIINAFVAPINVTAEYVDRIGKGDIPPKITDDYKGDFNEIKNNLNMCIDAINGLVNESLTLSKASVEGYLDKRGNTKDFYGDYRKIINGMNNTIDAIVGHIESIKTPVMIVDKEFNIKYMNETGAKVIGQPKSDITGKKCYDLFKTSDCKNGKCAVANAMKNDIAVTESTDAHPNGLNLIIEYTGVPVKDEDGKIIGGLEVVFDKTEVSKALDNAQVAADEAQKSADKAAVAIADAQLKVEYLNSIPTPIMVVDKEFNIQYMNPAGASCGMMEQHDLIGKKCYDIFKTTDCQNSKCAIGRAFREDKVITSDTVAKLPGGDLPIRYFGTPLKNENGEIVGALEYVLDISTEMDITTGIKNLAKAAGEGRLDERADVNKFQGNYRDIVEAVNNTILNLVEPMKEAASVMSKIANKDITSRVNGDYLGQLDDFKNDINTAASNLDDALQNIANSVEQISAASNQVAQGSQHLAEGSNEQASAIEQVSASLEEMASMTLQNSDNSNQAKVLAETAQKAAVDGQKNMNHMSEAIQKIKDSSDQTSKIVKTIDEIAFQTNLLALNAAVEAARAGEAGKGFAVVAEEVRNLAQRSAEAAKNTAQLIDESVTNADDGVKISKLAAEGLESIVESVRKTNELINEIAAASKEQSIGIEQISTAVQEMNKVTQENASNSEESASAAEEMSSQATSMSAMVGEFKLSRSIQHNQSLARMPKPKPKEKVRKKSQVIKPDTVIPLDDDEFDDF